MHKLIRALCLFAICGSGLALAEERQGRESVERKETLSFEDEMIQGGTQKPELFFLFQKKNFNYQRLIKMRENFIPEMRRSGEDVEKNQRGGS